MKNNTPDIFKFRHETVERAIGRDRRDIVRIHSGNLDVDVSLEEMTQMNVSMAVDEIPDITTSTSQLQFVEPAQPGRAEGVYQTFFLVIEM